MCAQYTPGQGKNQGRAQPDTAWLQFLRSVPPSAHSWRASVFAARTVCGFLPPEHGQNPPVLWEAKKTEKNLNLPYTILNYLL
jgi:hypothetical protein